jgi:hypothetical protein
MKRCFIRKQATSGSHVWALDPNFRNEILFASAPRNLSRKRRRPSAPAKMQTDEDASSPNDMVASPFPTLLRHSLPPKAFLSKAGRKPTAAKPKPRRHSIAGTTQETVSSTPSLTAVLKEATGSELADWLLNAHPSQEVWMADFRPRSAAASTDSTLRLLSSPMGLSPCLGPVR